MQEHVYPRDARGAPGVAHIVQQHWENLKRERGEQDQVRNAGGRVRTAGAEL
jgi:hypothetical protein